MWMLASLHRCGELPLPRTAVCFVLILYDLRAHIYVLLLLFERGNRKSYGHRSWKKAQKKYDAQFDVIRFRVPEGQREVIQKYTEEHGESVNQMINRLIEKETSENRK